MTSHFVMFGPSTASAGGVTGAVGVVGAGVVIAGGVVVPVVGFADAAVVCKLCKLNSDGFGFGW